MRKFTTSALLFAVLTTALPTMTAYAAPRPEVAEYVKAWQGTEGIKVWTLRYGPRDKHQALVQITGADHDWDGKIQLMNIEDKGARKDYSVMVNGKKYVVLLIDKYNNGEVYLPGEKNEHKVFYSDDLSSQGNAQYFLTDYLNQETGTAE
ncbi:MAG: hypothetical protein XXXJIFNMEKO3_02014 [Candidatus Erwinia impunctatus]|nr:hypothetical protein XXXJIFNMEKO_02014 [Culicoides impunctatus]